MSMPLSEAIRLGAALRPQAFSTVFDGVGTCALGAALESIGWKPGIDLNDAAWDYGRHLAFPLLRSLAAHPVYSDLIDSVNSIVISLNNKHCWSREQIADWIESVERQEVPITDAREVVTA